MARRVNWELVCMAAVLVACCAGAFAQDAAAGDTVVLYVDDDAQPGGDGFSWDSAHRTLQDALMFAHSFGADEIRVAQGVYKPDQGGGQTPGDRNATFSIPSGLALRGGYAGLTGDDPDARDWKKFETTLSGDLLGNDGPPGSGQNLNDNSLHVLSLIDHNQIVIEGMIVRAGRGFISVGQVIVGGGMIVESSQALVASCRFYLCSAWTGGAVSLRDSSVTIQDCQFDTNSAGEGGGAIALRNGSTQIEKSIFVNNNGGIANGGAIGAGPGTTSGGECVISECSFIGNRVALPYAGGAIAKSVSDMRVITCLFTANVSDNGGCISGGGVFEHCQFIDNAAVNVGGVAYGSFGTYIHCTFAENYSSVDGGAVYAGVGNSYVGCKFSHNFVNSGGGGGIYGSGMLLNCIFTHNDVWSEGGGGVQVIAPTTIINCLFAHNISKDPGAAIRINPGQHATLINTTITANNVLTLTGGVSVAGSATILNSILFGNASGDLAGSADVTYSCIGGGWPGEGNLDVDPQFVNSADDDFRLQPTAPCIDAADNTAMPQDTFDLDDDGDTAEPLPIDLDGLPRFRNNPASPNVGVPSIPGLPIVDMGAFEHQPLIPADINGDFCVNVVDLLAVIDAWGPCQPPEACKADIAPSGGDGVVDRFDLFQVVISWGCY